MEIKLQYDILDFNSRIWKTMETEFSYLKLEKEKEKMKNEKEKKQKKMGVDLIEQEQGKLTEEGMNEIEGGTCMDCLEDNPGNGANALRVNGTAG